MSARWSIAPRISVADVADGPLSCVLAVCTASALRPVKSTGFAVAKTTHADRAIEVATIAIDELNDDLGFFFG
jgi:hypothetical protein